MVNKKEKENNCWEKIAFCLFVAVMLTVLLVAVGGLFMQIGQENIDVSLSQEVADEICMQLTEEEFVVASGDYVALGFGNGGGLICDILSGSSVRGITINK